MYMYSNVVSFYHAAKGLSFFLHFELKKHMVVKIQRTVPDFNLKTPV